MDASSASLPDVPPSPWPRIRGLIWTGNFLVAIFLVGFGVWSAFAPLASAAIAAGVVVVESSRKTIQHFEGGIVSKILVRDGDVVAAGELLLRLDDTKARTQVQALRNQLLEAQARKARLAAERDGHNTIEFPSDIVARAQESSTAQVITNQQKIFETRRDVLGSELAVINERITQVRHEITGLRAQEAAVVSRARIIREEHAAIKPLVDKGLQTRPRLLGLEREMAEIDGRWGEIVARSSRAEQVIAESRATILKLQSDRNNELAQLFSETESQVSQLVERIEAAADQLARTEVRAPEAGVITDLRVHTLTGVVGAGAPLMDLVPRTDRLVIQVQLKPEDIDVVRTGLPAEVHLSAYKQRRVQPLNGVVKYVSADSLVDKRSGQHYYDVKIQVNNADPAAVRDAVMIPGMPVSAFIRTGEVRVALYVIQPILDSFNRAFRED